MSTILPTPPPSCPYHNKAAQTAPPAPESADPRDPAGLADKLHDDRGATIPCPFWRVVINENMVPVSPEGNVKMSDVRHVLKETGVGFALRETAMLGIKNVAAKMSGAQGGLSGLMAAFHADQLNVLNLPQSSLMHTGDSGILRGGFHQENLDTLLSYSSDGQNVTLSDLAAANKKQVEADPGESGHRFGVAEYSILVSVFGSKNEAGEKYLSNKDLTTLFKDNRFPEDWKKNNVGLFSLGSTVFQMFDHQKNDDPRPEAVATTGADKAQATAKSCPFLSGKPFSAEEAAKQHSEVLP